MKNLIKVVLLVMSAAIVSYGQDPCTTILDDHVRIHADNDDVVIEGPETEPTGPPDDPNSTTKYKPKVVSWLHGMNGDIASWSIASTYAETEYNAIPIREEYSQASTMDASISSMNERQGARYAVAKHQVTPDRRPYSFAIAHSLGGIVARGVSANYGNRDWMNGLVTFNTAHKGSKLADYLHYGSGATPQPVQELQEFVRQSISDLANPWISYYAHTNTILSVIQQLASFDVNEILKNSSDGISFGKSVDTLVQTVLKDIGSPAAANLTPDYLASATFQDQLPDDRKMMVYTNIISEDIEAKEPNTSAFKMFYSARKGVNSEGPFGSGIQTTRAVDQLDKNMNVYEDYREIFDDIWHMQPWLGSWVPISAHKKIFIQALYGVKLSAYPMNYNAMRDTRDKFKIGYESFHKINNFWEHMCGVTSYTSVASTGTCHCIDYAGANDVGEPKESYFYDISEATCLGKNDSTYVCTYSPQTIVAKHGYDGFITSESQRGWDGVLNNYRLYFEGSNHVQIRNDENTKIAIDNIFRTQRRFFGK